MRDGEEQGAAYVVKGILQQGKLSLLVFDVGGRTLQKFEHLRLIGKLQTDRRLIHKLSNSLIKLAFGAEGIADLTLLYCVQPPGQRPDHQNVGIDWQSEIWECDVDGQLQAKNF